MTRALPPGAVKYKETKRFTADTVPAGLTRHHATKSGVWGLICVDQGTLDVDYGDPVLETMTLKAGQHTVVAPEEVHKVTLHPNTEFHVEFYSAADA